MDKSIYMTLKQLWGCLFARRHRQFGMLVVLTIFSSCAEIVILGAHDKELYIVRAVSSVLGPTKSWAFFAGGNISLNPGDTIVVPINSGYTDNLTLWRKITQTIFNTTAGFASMIAVTR